MTTALIFAVIEKETEKAILVSGHLIASAEWGLEKVWLPKSQITIENKRDAEKVGGVSCVVADVTLPVWLWNKNKTLDENMRRAHAF